MWLLHCKSLWSLLYIIVRQRNFNITDNCITGDLYYGVIRLPNTSTELRVTQLSYLKSTIIFSNCVCELDALSFARELANFRPVFESKVVTDEVAIETVPLAFFFIEDNL